MTEGKSVGDVCSYANTGDVDLAFVYSSDVYRFGNVKIVARCPPTRARRSCIPLPCALTPKTPRLLKSSWTGPSATKTR